MSVDAAIRRFRELQADQMAQACTIVRPVGEQVTDRATGQVTQAVATIGVGVPCKVTAYERQGQDVQAAETDVRIVDHTIKFPVGTPVEKDDLVTITASDYNPLDVGRQYRITDVDRREWQISRRCVIEEVMVPMLWSEGGGV